jgi:probable rRNA maturation factor
MPGVNFYNQDIAFKLSNPRKTTLWIKSAIREEGFKLSQVNYIFCSDDHLRSMNIEYLNHKTYTDIITFDNSEHSDKIEGDIFISIDRVRDNSKKLKTDFLEELHRVLIHGILHLAGYSDKSPRKKAQMRRKEDEYLALLRK